MDEKKHRRNAHNYDLDFEFVLTIIFLVLKCEGKIDWSYWWVFSPLVIWGGIILLNEFIEMTNDENR